MKRKVKELPLKEGKSCESIYSVWVGF